MYFYINDYNILFKLKMTLMIYFLNMSIFLFTLYIYYIMLTAPVKSQLTIGHYSSPVKIGSDDCGFMSHTPYFHEARMVPNC